MTSDFVETNPFGGSVGDWLVITETALRALQLVDPSGPRASVRLGDARSAGVDLESRALVVTDPPYYSAIGYANLSDYFYVWLRPALRDVLPDLFSTLAAPKAGELIAEPARHGASEDAAREYFIRGFTETFTHLSQVSDIRFPMIVIYASKEQESSAGGQLSTAWEAMLEAVVKSGLAIAGTWPIHGTGSTRLRGLGANALATYVAMICRERPVGATPTTRRAFLAELRAELDGAVSVMQSTAIAPVDLAQAVIGPGMAVFSRYARVVEADGSEMSVRTALALINQVLDETLAGQEADFDPDTRWAVAWFEENGMSPGQFGVAEALSRAKNTAVNGLVASGIVEAVAGKVRLLDRGELPEAWDPAKDRRFTVWEATQHLIRALESGGEAKAAELLRRLGVLGEAARELAYRLYVICERKKWAKDALAYNGLVVAWPTIAAASASPALQVSQQELL
jgi:putative DNA methylase